MTDSRMKEIIALNGIESYDETWHSRDCKLQAVYLDQVFIGRGRGSIPGQAMMDALMDLLGKMRSAFDERTRANYHTYQERSAKIRELAKLHEISEDELILMADRLYGYRWNDLSATVFWEGFVRLGESGTNPRRAVELASEAVEKSSESVKPASEIFNAIVASELLDS